MSTKHDYYHVEGDSLTLIHQNHVALKARVACTSANLSMKDFGEIGRVDVDTNGERYSIVRDDLLSRDQRVAVGLDSVLDLEPLAEAPAAEEPVAPVEVIDPVEEVAQTADEVAHSGE